MVEKIGYFSDRNLIRNDSLWPLSSGSKSNLIVENVKGLGVGIINY